MARPKETSSRLLVELTEELQCAICNDQLRKPKYLQCLHSYCEECLEQLAKISPGRGQKNLSCPLCREMTRVPREGVSSLKTNFMALNLLDKITSEEAGKKKGHTQILVKNKQSSTSFISEGKCCYTLQM